MHTRMKPDWLNDSSAIPHEVIAEGSYIRYINALVSIFRGYPARTGIDATAISGEKNESHIRQCIVPIVITIAKRGLPKLECRKAMGIGPEYPIWQRSFHSTLSKGSPCTREREAVDDFNTING